MIFDIGWIEILLIAAVAIVVVGPKDLPRMMRIVGQWVGKARSLAREFQRSIDDMVRESELDDLRKEVEELRKLNPVEEAKKALDPNDDLAALDANLKAEMTELSEPVVPDLEKEQEEKEKSRSLSSEETSGDPEEAVKP